MNKNEKNITTIRSLSHDGRGIASIDQKVVFIENALPDEEVTFTYLRNKPSFSEGVANTISMQNPNRVEPKCQHFSYCGGCSLQHMSSEYQLMHKQNVLIEQIEHFGKTKPKSILTPVDSPAWEYRSKARLSVKNVIKKNAVLVGFHEKHSRFVACIESCPVLDSAIGTKIMALREMIEQLSIKSHIPQIEVAIAEPKPTLIIRHLKPLLDNDIKLLIDFEKKYEFCILLQPKGMNSIHALDNQPLSYLNYTLPNQNLTFDFYPTDFTQVNQFVNQKLVQQALVLLELNDNDIVLDLFCGLGNFSLPIAKTAKHVTGIEGSSEMVARAKHNAKKNQISNTSFYEHDLTQPITNTDWQKSNFNKLLIDPPRSGAEKVLHALNKWPLERIVYVSCNPATLARDIGVLVHQYGYTLETVGVFNMFPHTAHVESIALLKK